MNKKTVNLSYQLILNILTILISLICVVFTFRSLHNGIPWFDEAVQILPAYKFLLGYSSFTQEYSFLQLPSLLLYPIFKIYYWFNHHTIESLFIVERRFYTCIAIACCLGLTYLLQKSFPFYVALLIAINLVSFTPFGLHSPGYDNFPMLFLTLSFFAFLYAFDINQKSQSKAWLLSFSGFFLALAITVYPIISIYCPFGFIWLYKQSKFKDFKYYLLGLTVGSLWLLAVILYKGITSILLSIQLVSARHTPKFFCLEYALIWYKNILLTLKFPIIGLLILRFFRSFFRNFRWVWELLVISCLLHLVITMFLSSDASFDTYSNFGKGMSYTVALFFLSPLFFSFIYPSKLAKQLFNVWISSLILCLPIAYFSWSVGFSTVIVLFPGALVGLIYLYLIFQTMTETNLIIKHLPHCLSVLILFMFVGSYQIANINYAYGDVNKPATYVISDGALKSLHTTKEGFDLITHLEASLKPLSGKNKTLSVFWDLPVIYFINDFIPYLDESTNLIPADIMLYYKKMNKYPDIIVIPEPVLGRFTSFPPLPIDVKKILNQKYNIFENNKDYTIYTHST